MPDADRIHAVDRYWRVAEFLGAGDVPKRFHVPQGADEMEAVRKELAELPRPWVAVAVGAKWVTKRWPPAHFAEVLRRMQREFGGSAIFVGSGEDTAASREVMQGLECRYPPPGGTQSGSADLPHKGAGACLTSPPVGEVGGASPPGGGDASTRDLTGKTSLPRLAALLAQCDVMLANDTGPLHLAAALGVPCVAPYTCTRVALHGPYTSMKGGVETRVPCAGSYIKSCRNMICMPELSPDRLWPTLAEVLDAWQRKYTSRSA